MTVAKVDGLVHISDHGPRCQFTDAKMAAVMAALQHDGKYQIEAGKSSLEITRLGRVTMTSLFQATGRTTTARIHYSDTQGNLGVRVDNVDEVTVLSHVIFGTGTAPAVLAPRNGAEADAARAWIKAHGWTLAGEAGLRAKAADDADMRKIQASAAAANKVAGAEIRLKQAESYDAAAATAKAKAEAKAAIAKAKAKAAELEAAKRSLGENLQAWKPGSELPPVGGVPIWQVMSVRRDWVDAKDRADGIAGYESRLVLHATAACWSHPPTAANYSATIDGSKVRLSSGIVCDVSPAAVLEWLKNPALPAPVSRYGTLQRLELSRPGTTTPWIAVKCGCHILDLTGLGEEWAAALVPTHTVSYRDGSLAMDYSEATHDAFVLRVTSVLDKGIEQLQLDCRRWVREYGLNVKAFKRGAADKPARVAAAVEELAQAKSRQVAAVAAVAAVPPGATLAQVQAMIQALVGCYTKQFTY